MYVFSDTKAHTYIHIHTHVHMHTYRLGNAKAKQQLQKAPHLTTASKSPWLCRYRLYVYKHACIIYTYIHTYINSRNHKRADIDCNSGQDSHPALFLATSPLVFASVDCFSSLHTHVHTRKSRERTEMASVHQCVGASVRRCVGASVHTLNIFLGCYR